MKSTTALIASLALVLIPACNEKEDPASNDDKAEKPGKEEAGGGAPDPAPATEDTVESLAGEMMDHMEKVAETFSKVTDTASAEEASAKVKAMSGTITKIAERLAELPEPAEDEKKEISAMVAKRQSALTARLGSRDDFLETLEPDVRTIVEDGMSSFIDEMIGAHVVFAKYFQGGAAGPPSQDPPPAPANEPEPAPEPSEAVLDPNPDVAPRNTPLPPPPAKPPHPATTIPTPNVPPAVPR